LTKRPVASEIESS